MSENLTPPEREEIYRRYELEELLEDTPPQPELGGRFELADRRDAFGNRLVLAWDPTEEAAHLYVEGEDMVRTTGDRAADAFDHPYPYMNPGRPNYVVEPAPKPTRWDKALDEVNELPQGAREEAIAMVDQIRGGAKAVPTLMFDAVKTLRELRGLDRAA